MNAIEDVVYDSGQVSLLQAEKGEKEEVEAKAVGPFLLQQACGGMRERS